VVVVGGGFAGLNAAKALRRAPVELTLVDRTSYHLFQPLLYQVATGILSEGEVAYPLRDVLRRWDNARVILAEVDGLDLERRLVHAAGSDGRRHELPYDSLVVSPGARYAYFGHEEWERFAPGLKSLEDARLVRSRILGAFEAAELDPDPAERSSWLTFVVVGAGPTGVELAGQIAELARGPFRRGFREIDTRDARIVLVDAAPLVLGTFDPRLADRARRELERMGVQVRLETAAAGVDGRGIDVRLADGSHDRIETRTVLWAAGVQASGLAAELGRAVGAAVDRAGRVAVGPDLTLPGHPEVFLCGDAMSLDGLPGVAQVAIQQGRHAGRSIAARAAGRPAPGPFRYRDKGSMATIGRLDAVCEIRGVRLSGFLAAVVWAAVHLTFLIGFANRLVTMTRWTAIVFAGRRAQRAVELGRREVRGHAP
jgi:NADH dehydrogenase